MYVRIARDTERKFTHLYKCIFSFTLPGPVYPLCRLVKRPPLKGSCTGFFEGPNSSFAFLFYDVRRFSLVFTNRKCGQYLPVCFFGILIILYGTARRRFFNASVEELPSFWSLPVTLKPVVFLWDIVFVFSASTAWVVLMTVSRCSFCYSVSPVQSWNCTTCFDGTRNNTAAPPPLVFFRWC